MNPQEHRRASRTKHDSVLEVYDLGGNFIVGIGRLVNFSKAGVCFSSTKTLTKGEMLRVRLRLLKEGVLEVSARVVWMKKKLHTMVYGLMFVSVQQIRF